MGSHVVNLNRDICIELLLTETSQAEKHLLKWHLTLKVQIFALKSED